MFCNASLLGKPYRLHFGLSENKTHVPLEIVHFDPWGPIPIISFNGYKYYVNFMDDFARYS